jgi:hypothetical protein
MGIVPSYTQLATENQYNNPWGTSSKEQPRSVSVDPTLIQPTPVDSFTPTTAKKQDSPKQVEKKPQQTPWTVIVGGVLALVGLMALGFWQKETITKWFNPEKVVAGASKVSELLPLSAEQTEALQKMHAVFNEPSPDGRPWYRLKVNTLGEATETEVDNYLNGAALIKDAKKLYLGDLHGSWLKGLLQLAQMEAIVMPEATAKEFLAIHEAFKAVETTDEIRISELLITPPMVEYKKKLFAETLQKVTEDIASNKLIPEKGKTAQDYALKQFENRDVGRLYKQLSFCNNKTKAEVHALVKRFKAALASVDVTNPNKQLNLVGDVLGDRGQLDLLTLLLMEKFKDNVNIVASNHDFGTLDLLINYLSGGEAGFYITNPRCFNSLYFGQSQSSGRLLIDYNKDTKKLLETAGVSDPSFTKAEALQLYKTYFSRLKLLHYDAEDQAVMLHSLVRNESWEALVNFLKPDSPLAQEASRKALSSEGLTQAVDELNTAFQQKIMSELNSNTVPSQEFERLQTLLNDHIWYGDDDGRANSFDYSLFPSFGNNVGHVMVGHNDYNGGSLVFPTNSAVAFHQLDNNALKHTDYTDKISPVVVSK